MEVNNLTILLLYLFALYFVISMRWKKKADLFDKKNNENYVPNYEELIRERQYRNFKRRVDYFFISLSSFSNWVIERSARRMRQTRAFRRDEV